MKRSLPKPLAPKASVARSRGSRGEATRALAMPVAVSLSLHVIAVVVLALLVSSSGSEGPAFEAPIHASLTTPEPRFAVPEPHSVPPAVERERPLPAVERERPLPLNAEPALLPMPMKPPLPPVKGTPQGMVTIQALAATDPAEPAMAAVVGQIYPGAIRAQAEFEVPPTGIYPKGALADKLQLNVRVLVVVHEDGRVELAQGTFDDPLFTPAIRASLATAKARPLEKNGRPRTSWSLLSFAFEYVGER